jgi:DNA-binding LacI/PurR family transcriptional regulator
MAVTIKDVAEKAGVSKSTVSNFLNGKYGMMSEETRRLLEKTVKDLSYTPNLSARRLPNKDKSRTVCLIIPRNLTHIFDTMYYPTVFHSIEKMAEEMKFNVLIYSRNRTDPYNEMQYLKGLAGSIVDGFIIYDLSESDMFFREFQKSGIPYVCVGKIDGVDNYQYVASDHHKIFLDTCRYLYQLGHRKIGWIRNDEGGVVDTTRHRAAQEFVESKNNAITIEEICIPIKSSETEVNQIIRNILSREDRPTAFIVPYGMKQSLVMTAKDLGMNIPEDLSYIDIEHYRRSDISCDSETRVESKAGLVSELAFKKLLRKIYAPDLAFQSETVSLEITLGDTTSTCKQDMPR